MKVTPVERMEIQYVDPEEVEISDYNERVGGVDKDSEEYTRLKNSVETVGIKDALLGREDDDGNIKIVDGQRRLEIAQDLGKDRVKVEVRDIDPMEALELSVVGNSGELSKEVHPGERARSLHLLWTEKMGESGFPSSRKLSEEIGLSEGAVQNRIEPLHPDWEGTEYELDVDNPTDFSPPDGSVRKLATVRRITGGGSAGESIADMVDDEGWTDSELNEINRLTDAHSVETAVSHVIRGMPLPGEETDSDATQGPQKTTDSSPGTTQSPERTVSPSSPSIGDSTASPSPDAATEELSASDNDGKDLSWMDRVEENREQLDVDEDEEDDEEETQSIDEAGTTVEEVDGGPVDMEDSKHSVPHPEMISGAVESIDAAEEFDQWDDGEEIYDEDDGGKLVVVKLSEDEFNAIEKIGTETGQDIYDVIHSSIDKYIKDGNGFLNR